MNVAEVLDIEQIVMDLEALTKEEVINSLATKLEEKGVLTNKEYFMASVMEREEHSTTGIGNGIAIPHGKSEVVLEAAIAFAKLRNPVEWQSLDDQPVSIVIMLAIPDSEKGDTHLRLLSEIAVKLMDDEFVEALKKKTEPLEVVRLLG